VNVDTYDFKPINLNNRNSLDNGGYINLLMSMAFSGTVIFVMLLTSNNLLHHFLLPVWACGVVIGIDVIDWARNRMDVLDPVGVMGIFGLFYFFLAPLLHPYLNLYLLYVEPLAEWRDWLGFMAWINLIGLCFYRWVRNYFSRAVWEGMKTTYRPWKLNRRRFKTVLMICIPLSLALQTYVYYKFGGVIGYINSFSNESGAFDGMGYLFVVSESPPCLALMGYLVLQQKSLIKSIINIVIVLVCFFVLLMFFDGFW